jgi:phytoene dehydrogenase-like protein
MTSEDLHEYAEPTSFEYDAVIIGAGHNGLTLGSYLARSGLSVGIVERRAEEGGGLCTEELTLPGFLHNLHANYHTFVNLSPAFEDLDLYEHGLEYSRPEVQMASVFPDGTALTVHTDLDKTCASMSRFSEKDAETFRRLYTEAHGYVDLLLHTLMYEPPMTLNELTRALTVFGVDKRSEFLEVGLRRMSITEFLNKHFEHPKIKAHLAFHAAICGYTSDMKGLAVGFPLLVGKIDNWHVCLGGSHRLAHVLWRDFARNGGVIHVQQPVEKIIVDGGRAVGVRTVDGTEFYARKLVASSVDLSQTFLTFVGKEHLDSEFVGKVEDAEAHKHKFWTLFSVHLALEEPPLYEAASFDPDVNKAWVVNLGYDSLEALNSDWDAIRAGEAPAPKPNAAVNTLFDPSDAPEGKYTGLLRQFAPYALRRGGASEWRRYGPLYASRCIDEWRRYAPNLDASKVIDYVPYTPLDIEEKLINMVRGDWMMGEISPDNLLERRPFPELSEYRTPIEGLYMCGSTQHPHGFITFGPAYNALQVIAEDLGIEKWWKKV